MRNSKLSFAPLTSLAIGITALAISSCSDSDDGVRVYEVIIPPGGENSTPAAPTRPSAPNTLATPSSNGPALTWTAPESWTKIANANQFDRARYEVAGADGEKATATVTAGIGGSVPMNVNRWRGQLGLGAASEPELKAAAIPVQTADSAGVIFELAGPDGSRKILAAILPIPGDTYYFKLDGPPAIVDAERDAFMTLVNSSKIDKSGSTPAATTSAPEPAALKFNAPSGWTAGSNDDSSSMRAASYTTANGGEIAILRFRKTPDAIVQNVNIWRQEAGLDAATSEDQLALTEVKSTDGELTWKVHQVDSEQSTVLAAFAPQGETLWVVRLKTTPAQVSNESAEMTAFLQSATSN